MAQRWSVLDALLDREVVRRGVAPAAVAAVATRYDGRWLAALGAAGTVGGEPTTIDTPFDLASVTKPLLALTCARLAEQGRWAWSARLGDVLPELSDTFGGQRSVSELLSHRAHLQAHVELFAALRERRPVNVMAALRQAAGSVRPGAEDGTALYSDLGYLLVGQALERSLGEPLDEIVTRELCAPLGLTGLGSSRQWRRQDPSFAHRVAPTENVPWRGGVLRGVVHDDNAWALGGHGSSGHAGLFATAEVLLRVGVACLQGDLLGSAALDELTRPRPGGSLRMGFDGKADQRSMAGRVAGPSTFGHLGYTGTSLWCDPDAGTVTVLLTNRVHPSASNQLIREARPRVHDELFQLAWNCRMPSRAAGGMLPLGGPSPEQ